MGNADSTYFSTVIDSWKNPDLVPKVTDKPKHEPNYGFAESRAERGYSLLNLVWLEPKKTLIFLNTVAKASEEDMYYARIPANRRDYCGNLLIDLQRCKRENYPFVGRCEHYVHEWNDCQNE